MISNFALERVSELKVPIYYLYSKLINFRVENPVSGMQSTEGKIFPTARTNSSLAENFDSSPKLLFLHKQMTMDKFSSLNLDGVYSYADYLKWKLEERIELIKAKIFKMSPAPSMMHQVLVSELQGFSRSCSVYILENDLFAQHA